MTINYAALKARNFEPVEHVYSHLDTRLYALGLNLGSDPLDERQLAHVAAEPPAVLPTMATVLGRLGPWMKQPDVGVDYSKIVVGEVSMTRHAALPSAGRIISEHHIESITDKGEGRGALVTVQRQIKSTEGLLLAEFSQTTFCRADGGFAVDGVHDPAPPAQEFSYGENVLPHHVAEFQTSPQQALIYRLTGDMNPLHSDPQTARAAGFERPILHGLATFGMAGFVLSEHLHAQGAEWKTLTGRFSAPVTPGDRLLFKIWHDADACAFRAYSMTSGKMVMDRGRSIIL